MSADPHLNADIAWKREDARRVLDVLQREGLAVPGGDVCELTNGELKYNYDNWYCNPTRKEQFASYADRSVAYAVDYIERYPEPSGSIVMYVLVVSDVIYDQPR